MNFNIFARMLAKEIMLIFISVVFVLMMIILGFRFSRLLAQTAGGNLSLDFLWKIIALQAVNLSSILIPTAFIVACVMSLSRLYHSQEITAFFAASCSSLKLSLFLLIPTIPVAIIVCLVSLFVLPHTYSQISQLRTQAKQEAGYAMISENSFRSFDRNTTLHVDNIEDKKLQNFFLAQENNGDLSAIFSDSANIFEKNNKQILGINNGFRVSWNENMDLSKFSLVEFNYGELKLNNKENINSKIRTRELALSQLDNSKEHRAELQKRFNSAIALLIFIFIIPLICYSSPRKISQRVLPAFLLFALYINLCDVAVKAMSKGKIPLIPGSFIVHIFFILLILLSWIYAKYKRIP